LQIVERKEDRTKVRLVEKYKFEPTGPFQIEVVMDAQCRVAGSVLDEKVLAWVREGGYSLYAARTQLIGGLTGMIVGVPLIIPPCHQGPGGTEQLGISVKPKEASDKAESTKE
jgi:hypothetical protein